MCEMKRNCGSVIYSLLAKTYEQIFRLKGWTYHASNSKRPMQMAQITVDLVFDRIGPGLTKDLRERRHEIFEETGKKGHLHRLLTPDVGHPALQHHLSGTTFLAKAFPDGEYAGFHRAMDRVAPRRFRTMEFAFPERLTFDSTESEPPSSQ